MEKKINGPRGENMTMRALYLLAIIFVVDGHTLLGDMFTLDGLFRYYSFHLMLFAFGSGYFYKAHGTLIADIAHRAKRLLVPLYAWNFIYGIGTAILHRFGEFELGAELSAYTLLIAPIVDGEQFVWNLGAWYIFPLFAVQCIYAAVRRLAVRWGDREGVTFAILLIPGVIAAQLCHMNMQAGIPVAILRPLILLPGYAGGVLYRRVLEKHDSMKTAPYMLIVLALRALLCVRYENLAYLLSKCTFFACDAFGVYAGAALAIAFWLRVARLIGPHMQKSRLALYASRHTFDIMMHHYMGFFALNSVFLVLNALGIGAADFSVKTFRTVYHYNYAPDGRSAFNVLYLLAGIFLPLGVARATDAFKAAATRRRARKS